MLNQEINKTIEKASKGSCLECNEEYCLECKTKFHHGLTVLIY